ncbi:Rho Gtpase-Activating Protein 21 [Manis pentadactyla]|nr:Rho Gtpase-Activating Protein 21 [Manis pentadactyla]
MSWQQHSTFPNEANTTDEQEPMGREAIPLQEPMWDYNTPEGEVCRDRMVRHLLAVSKYGIVRRLKDSGGILEATGISKVCLANRRKVAGKQEQQMERQLA